MARRKKEEKKSNVVMLALIGIMFFGTIAGGLLFQTRNQEERPLLTTPPPAPQEEIMTIRHNPVNMTVLTPSGYQTVYYSDTHIFVDSNHPLANKTLIFDIEVTNMTRANYTGATSTLTVENGDIIKVNYTGHLETGEVFDTSHPEMARNASVPKVSWFNERPFYEPLEFTVGAGVMIEGFDEAVVGMKVNENKTVKIPAEQGYGLHDPSLVETVPIIQGIQKTMQIGRFLDFTEEEFRRNFGNINITQGQTFNVPGTDFNASIMYTSENRVVVEMLPRHGEIVRMYDYPWSSTVVLVTPGYLLIEHNVKSGDTVQFSGMPWNTTIL